MSLEILSADYPSSYLLDSEEYREIREDISDQGWDISISKTSTLSATQPTIPEPTIPESRVSALPLRQDDPAEVYIVKPRPGYIQGIIRGPQAYLITNLRSETSSTLIQPQMTWTIGRNRDAALPLPDRMLSRRHSVLMYVKNEGFYLVDLNSLNGSYVNGKRIENRVALHDGDFIRVGHTEFFFFLSSGYRKLEAIHPEILNRLLNPEEKGNVHIDYAEIREEISFNLNR
jgi:pSer/pThr/pTyr-binding forkhead associated (FHA) protein